jgi:hypothetical protein
MEKLVIREKRTAPIVVQLLADGSPIDLAGVHAVQWDMKDKRNKVYRYNSNDASPAVIITDTTNGKVTFTPPDENVFQYLSSPYRFYILVYDTSTSRYAVPEKESAEISLLKEY